MSVSSISCALLQRLNKRMHLLHTLHIPFHEDNIPNMILIDEFLCILADLIPMKSKHEVLTDFPLFLIKRSMVVENKVCV